MMEFHSKRFKSVRTSDTTGLSQGTTLHRRQFPSAGTRSTTNHFLYQNRTTTIHHHPGSQKKKYKGSLFLRWLGLLRAVYALPVICFHFIASLAAACLPAAFICQNRGPHPDSSFRQTHQDYIPLEQTNLASLSARSKSRVSKKSGLYSSDSEDDADDNFNGLFLGTEFPCYNDGVPVITDYDLPLVCFIDNVIYFFLLYFTNYPAFVLEFSQGLRNNRLLTKKVSYGHNLNPKERRPAVIKKGVNVLKKRKQREIMTRVSGSAHKVWVLRTALASRLVIFVIQIVTSNLPQIFKHNNDGFKFTPEEGYGQLLDPLVNATFGGYVNWDAHYFLHISVYGYTSENVTAFFPLLPLLLYLPSRILSFMLGGFISQSSIILILGVIFNVVIFVKCADNIYEIASFRLGATRQLITTACILFCFNPASIFFSGLYSETLFAYLTSSVLLHIMKRETEVSLISAALSTLCRSNGILNVGFILAYDLQRQLRSLNTGHKVIGFCIRCVLKLLATGTPFLLYQIYCHITFCDRGRIYDDPSEVPLYCVQKGLGWLPYSYVQKKYWNVGFLEYFKFKQLPNFVLAAPVLYVLGSESWARLKVSSSHLLKEVNIEYIFPLSNGMHGLFLTIFCFLFTHVQVSTRMIMAACPYIYIYLASIHEEEVERFRKREISLPVRSLAMTLWCAIYYVIGTIAFSLGLPWT